MSAIQQAQEAQRAQAANQQQQNLNQGPEAGGKNVSGSLQPVKKREPPKILVTEIGKAVIGKGFQVDNGISYQRLKIG